MTGRDRPERCAEAFGLVHDPPFRLDGARAFLFLVRANRFHVARLLDRTFGWAAPEVVVHPLGSSCLLVVTDVARASARDPGLGHFRYREAAVFVPVWGMRDGRRFMAMHVPFIWPDSGLAVAAGREVYGLPKKPATLAVPDDDAFWDGEAPITARVVGARAFDGGAWTEQPLLTVRAVPQSLVAALADEVLDRIDAAIGPLPGPLGAFGRMLEQDFLQLKQVADVDPGDAPARVLYRAITRVEAPLRAVRNVRIGDADRVRIRIEELASEPLREELGLDAEQTPELAASLEMDFTFEPGEVWLEKPVRGPSPVTGGGRREKVLVLGGGMGALATAYVLTDGEARRARFDVRVLAQGHLLGGKGASSRNLARGGRIEEHGIHVLFGFYHNCLRLMRDVYRELGRPHHVDPTTFDEAFTPRWEVVFHDGADGWKTRFPRTPDGFGAGPKSIEDQLFFLGTLLHQIFGRSVAALLEGILPGRRNRVEAETLAFTLTLMRGVLSDVVLRGRSFDDLDGEDFRDWMARHRIPGFPDLGRTAIMQVPYDGVFAYEGHDQSRPRLSAGIAARGLLKLVADYEEALFFDMRYGMGESVFAPLYEVLAARGVRFEQFAKVKELRVRNGRVEAVRYARQAEVLAGPFGYLPIVDVGPVRTFRSEPDLAQLAAPAPIAGKDPYSDAVTDQAGPDVELRVATDFDWVVCALPAPVTARVLTGHEAVPALARIASIPTVATLHLQTWLRDDLGPLGWPWGSVVLGGFRQPLNSLQENGRLIRVEGWTGTDVPRALLYASGPFGGGDGVDASDASGRDLAGRAARTEAEAFVRNHYGRLLPHFRIDRLFAPWTPVDPMADQLVRANVDLSSRYCLIRPGGLADRPRPAPPGVENLRFAGDWTRNGIDIPCMEGCVVSAFLAASSIMNEQLPILW